MRTIKAAGWAVVGCGLIVLALLGPRTELGAAEEPGDQSSALYKPAGGFWLLNPTPENALRDLSPDRPDATESPITVDAGHFQLEMSFVDFSRDKSAGTTTTVWTVADTNLKVGLTNTVDFQLVFAAHAWEQAHTAGAPNQRREGFSDITLRLKWNLWGNDPVPGQTTAFGLMPFVKIATGTPFSNRHAEGGLIAMFGWEPAEGWGLGLMLEADAVYDDSRGPGGAYSTDWVHTVVLDHAIAGPLGFYIEYLGVAPTQPGSQYQATFDAGLTWDHDENTSLDLGVRVGLNAAAEDFGIFFGLTQRY